MKQRLISVALIICMLLAVSSCGSTPFIDDGVTVNTREEPVTITYLTLGDKPTNGATEEVIDRVNKILLKKCNARLDIYYVGWSDYLNTYNRVLDEGKVDIDLVGTGTDWLDAWPNIGKGNFYPMTKEMLSTFCPMTYSNVSDDEWRKCSYQGSVYMIPENEFTQWTNHGFIYRGDIADEAGLGEIDNWTELTKYMKYVKENRPDMVPWDTDGTNQIIGLGYLMSSFRYNPIYEISTYGIWGSDRDNAGKIISPYYEGDDYLNFARLMKEWDKIGVWRKPLEGTRNTEEELYAGSTAIDQHHTQNFYTTIKPEMEINQPMSDLRFYWFGKEMGNVMRDSILHGATAVYAKSKNPEKALMVYDTLRNDEECYRLFRYGIEGKQYSLTRSGEMEKPSGYNSQRDTFLVNFWWGRRDDYELIDASYSWKDYYELVDQYEKVAVNYPWDGYNFAEIASDPRTKEIISIFDRYIPEIAYAQYDISAQDEVALFRQELKDAGFEEVTKEIQKIVDSY